MLFLVTKDEFNSLIKCVKTIIGAVLGLDPETTRTVVSILYASEAKPSATQRIGFRNTYFCKKLLSLICDRHNNCHPHTSFSTSQCFVRIHVLSAKLFSKVVLDNVQYFGCRKFLVGEKLPKIFEKRRLKSYFMQFFRPNTACMTYY